MQKTVTVTIDGKSASRVVSGGLLAEAASLLEGERQVFVVFDSAVAEMVPEIAGSLGGRLAGAVGIEAGEEMKGMDTVLKLTGSMLEAGLDRGGLVVAIGGGITTDIAGFAASIYKRGVRYANIPTTLLAQVDAAIGGKTGVNLDSYKNILGVIRQPQFTFICPEVLLTLPRREFFSGAAEMLKTFIIADAENYRKALALLEEIAKADDHKTAIRRHAAAIGELVSAAAAIKAGIVSLDQYESGKRRTLNLGHTFAHAIEHEALLRGDDITHGEAVAMGTILAAELSDKTGLSTGMEKRLREDFTTVSLPVDCPYPLGALEDAMLRDKKADGEMIHFILIRNIGEVVDRPMSAACAIALLHN